MSGLYLFPQERIQEENTVSGNLDSPEGGFDALLQTIVCQDVSLLDFVFYDVLIDHRVER